MKNPILRRINVTGVWQPLAATRTVGSFTIRANSSASTALALRSDDGLAEVPLERGVSFHVEHVNLADIFAKGSLGDFIVVLGSST